MCKDRYISLLEKKGSLGQLEFSNNDTNYEEWINRKSLLSCEDYNQIAIELYGSKELYKKLITSCIKKEGIELWQYEKIKDEIFSYYTVEYSKNEKKYIDYSLRGFLEYISKHILFEYKNILLDGKVIESIIQAYYFEINKIHINAIIDDIESHKNELIGDDPESRYNNYIDIRFSENNYKKFFTKYSYLLRVLVDKTVIFVENINLFLKRLNEDYKELSISYKLNSNILNNLFIGAGDSHDGGKNVIMIKFSDGKKILYKPKKYNTNNYINKIYDFINSKCGTEFKKIFTVTRKGYHYEEFIEKYSVSSKERIHSFYYRYGNLLGLAYLLNINDLHYENIIACGEYPVIIDTETFFQHNIPIKFPPHANNLVKNEYLDSIFTTGLLPFEILSERSKDKKRGIDISAVSKGEVEIPFKVLQVINLNTDVIKYDYVTAYTKKSENIPEFEGEEYTYKEYIEDIKKGFSEFLKKIIVNKEEINKFLRLNLKGLVVRNVLRGTQRYSDLLTYSYHANCLKNIRFRERTLENVFSHNYVSKKICAVEYKELLVGDIPQFFNDITSRHLLTNSGEEIKNVYNSSILSHILKKIEKLNKKEIDRQLLYIDFSFNNYEKYSQKKDLRFEDKKILTFDVLDCMLKNLKKELEDEQFICHTSKTVNWLDIISRDSGTTIQPLDSSLYDGLAGIYLFYVLYEYRFKTKCNEIKEYIYNTVFSISNKEKSSETIYKKEYSLIYPLLLDYKLNNNKDSLVKAEVLVNDFNEQLREPYNFDWIQGVASYAKICYELYKLTDNKKYNDIYIKILEKYQIPETYEVGFAHGISSIYHLYSLNSRFKENCESLNFKMLKCESSSWCRGATGILLSQLYRKNIVQEKEYYDRYIKELDNDSLCHGNAGLLELLMCLEDRGIDDYLDHKDKIVSNILNFYEKTGYFRLQGRTYLKSLGIYLGVVGVIYQLYRLLDRNIPNLLLLEV